LRIDENGSIWVDDYMRTNAKKVFAVGDCAVKRDFFTRKSAPIWLASTATAEARMQEQIFTESGFCVKFKGPFPLFQPRSAATLLPAPG